MKIALALAASVLLAAPAHAGSVSVSLGQPGFYGNIVIGDAPPPVVVYREPMVIQRTSVVYEPVYLHVRAGEPEHWSEHCAYYNACGRPVYFVQDQWYDDVYTPNYQKHHGHGDGHDNGHGDGDGNDNGNGKGHKHGHGKGHKG
jgi:hypothetical protein